MGLTDASELPVMETVRSSPSLLLLLSVSMAARVSTGCVDSGSDGGWNDNNGSTKVAKGSGGGSGSGGGGVSCTRSGVDTELTIRQSILHHQQPRQSKSFDRQWWMQR